MRDNSFDNLVIGISKILGISEIDKEVDRVNLDSSAIDSIEYDYVAQILHVTFNSGATYGYSGVTQEEVDDLINSSSVGRTFVREIRNEHVYWKLS
jgi:hypothetical protein